MENGGVYAVPNRGGGEYGKNGMMQELKCKSKMFDDFIAAAEYLIAQKYTSDFLPFVGVKWRFTRSYYDSVQN
jgi:prolyl oligopeptidase